MTALAKKAQFAPNPHRRAMVAKVHIAAKDLSLDEDTYQSVLYQVTGHMSAADCSEAELAAVIEHFRARGWQPKAKPKKRGRRAAADHLPARKARALWISLYNLGAIDNSSEQALEAFARRQLKVAALQWADQAICYKLIEALKAMAERHGWAQGGFAPGSDASRKLRVLKIRLCDAILAKLKDEALAIPEWRLEDAAWRLCGIEQGEAGVAGWDIQKLDAVAWALGRKLRKGWA